MTTYVIDYSDPLKPGFTIQPGGFDGPGGSVSSTSLRLYGRGALEWGESVDEDIVRLLENFAGATPPLNPTPGQLWYQQKLYWQNTLIALTPTAYAPAGAFAQYNLTSSAWYSTLGPTDPLFKVMVTSLTIGSYTAGIYIGDYVWSTADGALYRWDSAYKQALVAWLPRAITISATVPGASVPEQSLQIQSLSGTFATPNVTNATNATNAANVNLTNDTANATDYIVFSSGATGNQQLETNTSLAFNPSTGVLSATSFTGAGTGLTGTAASLSIGGVAATAGTATNATNTTITDDTTTAATMYPTWVTANTGNLPQKTTSTKLTFNPSTGVLSATSFTGAGTGLTGTAASLSIGGTAATATVANALNTTTVPVVVVSAAPTPGQVLTATSGTAAQWATPGGGHTVPTIINATPGTAYTVPAYTGNVLVQYSAFAMRGGAATLGWAFYLNGGAINSWAGSVNYQVAINPIYSFIFAATGTFTVEIDIQSDVSHPGQIVIYYF
jgi:hypothetical protein